MDVNEVLRTTSSCRYFTADPVPDEVLARIFDAARFGPQGGNRQPVRFIAVRHPQLKAQLGEWYLAGWEETIKGYYANVAASGGEGGELPPVLASAQHLAQAFNEVPVLVVVAAHFPSLLRTDAKLDRPGVVGGASVYPSVQSMMLAARNEGVGTCLTTLLCADEPQVKTLLEIPDEFITCATVAMGYPQKPFPTKLSRGPLAGMVYADRFGQPLFEA